MTTNHTSPRYGRSTRAFALTQLSASIRAAAKSAPAVETAPTTARSRPFGRLRAGPASVGAQSAKVEDALQGMDFASSLQRLCEAPPKPALSPALSAVEGEAEGRSEWGQSPNVESPSIRFSRLCAALGLSVLLTLGLALLLSGSPAPAYARNLDRSLFAPIVTGTLPSANALNVARTADIAATFDEPIDLTSVTSRTFAVYGSQSPIYTGAYSLSNVSRTVTLDPVRVFFPGERLQSIVTTGTLNITGQRAISSSVWQFWAAANAGTGRYDTHPISPTFGSGYSFDVALGDVDGDGDLDAVVANYFDQAETVWLNDGMGRFTTHPISPAFGAGDSRAVALGDVDRDGDLDAVVAEDGSAQTVWINDGAGRFASHPISPTFGAGNSYDVALGDVDGDGDLDAVVANTSNQPEDVYLNNGAGQFTAHSISPTFGSGRSTGVALGDVDGDGDLDAVVANYFDQAETVWLNDGMGRFASHPISPTFGAGDSQALDLGDLDGDGDLDAVIANDGSAQTVWLNDGTGRFAGHPISPAFGAGDSYDVALGDVDGDGDLDAIVANYSGQPEDTMLNNGTGQFTAHPISPTFGSGHSTAVALGDVDGDGDLDVVVANYLGQAETVWLNRDRADLAVSKSVQPGVVVPGQPLTYTLVYSNNGPQTAVGVVITDLVPVTLTNVAFTSSGAQITPTGSLSYTWQVEDLSAGEGGVITLTGVVSPGLTSETIFTNTAFITTTTFDSSGPNNRSSAAVVVTFPRVSFDSATYSRNEGGGQATITVTLDTAPFVTATVDYASSNGSATAGSDYTAVSGTLSFIPGVSSLSFAVPITDDLVDELDETVNLVLSNPVKAILVAPDNAVLTILDNDQPDLLFSASNYSANEGAGAATISVTLTATSVQTITVNYATGDGTATAGSDYTTATGVLTFTPGVLTRTFNVSIIDDLLDEFDETVMLSLANASNATLSGTNPVTLTILDNDATPMVQFSSAAYSIGENAGPATITATLSAASGLTVTVSYATSDGTAIAGSDYVTATGVLTFTPGVTSRTFTVPIINDTLDELNETVDLTLSGPSNATLGAPNPAVLTIVDDDATPTVQFSSAAYSVDENAGPATITATLSATSGLTVTVSYATGDGTATAGSDYVTATGVLTFTPGVTSQTFNIPITNDTLDELDETVNLTLSSPANATLGAPNPATLTIIDDDATPTVQFSSAAFSANENAGTATVTATLSAASGLTVTVSYATSDGTAIAGSDYTTATGVLTFAPGIASQTFNIPIINDTLDELNETVTLTLSNASNATLGAPNPATLTIVDDDATPTVQFSSVAYSVDENAGPATITATLSAASGLTVTVSYATSDGTATAGSDYVTATGVLTFTPGVTSQTFNVPITNDALDEPNETVTLTLSSPVNATLGAPNPAALTIVDDDVPTVQFSSAAYSANENAGTVTVTVTLNMTSWQTVTVAYASSNGTATAGSDYVTATGTLTFTPGIASQTFTVAILDDSSDEVDETVLLALSSPGNAALGAPANATLTILDDDGPAVRFSNAAFNVNENASPATVTVTLSAASVQTVTVSYATSNGTAVAGSDYVTATSTLTFAPGVITQTFSIPIINDTLDELNETVNLTLSSPVNATLGAPNPATLTIVDDDPAPTVQFSSAAYNVNENAGPAAITATLSAASGLTVTVSYATGDGTAMAGSDYLTATGVLTFTPGVTSQTFNVSITNDALDELNETVNLTLSSPVNAALGAPNPATLTIVDDDAMPTVQFSSATYSVNESGGTATITATLSAVSGLTVTVSYATGDGTATAGSDYTTTTGVLTFTSGVTSQTFTVPIINDALDELNETVNLTLSGPVNATLGAPNPAVLTIVDDDATPTVRFSSAAYSVGENAGPATITATLSAASGLTVTVSYATSDGTAIAGSDYTSATGVLTFTPGITSQTFNVPITNDLLDELDETVNLTLSSPANATLGAPNPATLTIIDDDAMPTVQFSSAAFSANENAGTATITATLSVASGLTITVDYATSDGTAVAGSDYITATGTLTFTPGVASQTFGVTVIDDPVDELDETVTLTLSNPISATLGAPNPATLTIVDNDPTAQFDNSAYSVDENTGTATVTATLSAAPILTVTLGYTTSNGTAVAGSDYITTAGALTFAPGVTSQIFSVPIINDTLDELNETIVLALNNPVSATLGTPASATLTIVDDDNPPSVQFGATTYTTSENAGTSALTLTLSAASSLTVTLGYAPFGGTATAGSDYTTLGNTLTFTPGVTSQAFNLNIVNDTLYELNETALLTITGATNAALGAPLSATLTIVDEDNPPAVQFSAASYTAAESAGTAAIAANLSAASGVTVTLDYATADGTAMAGSDYTPVSGTLTFAPGVVSRIFNVPIISDTVAESDETITLTLSNPVSATLGAPVTATLTIVEGPKLIYLPLLMRNFAEKPNLVVQSIVVVPPSPNVNQSTIISVTIANSGAGVANAGFWIDLYVDPISPPLPGQVWNDIAPIGKAWILRVPLAPGQSITLDTTMPDDPNDPGAIYSNWPGRFTSPGVHTLYAQADVFGSPAGLVVELDELDNLFGPLNVTVNLSGPFIPDEGGVVAPPLDPRPTASP